MGSQRSWAGRGKRQERSRLNQPHRSSSEAGTEQEQEAFPRRAQGAPPPAYTTVQTIVYRLEWKVFLTALLDLKGGFVTGKESIMDLALTGERLAVLEKEGLKAVTTLNAPAGAYQVRAIVREAMKGRLTASTTLVALGKK